MGGFNTQPPEGGWPRVLARRYSRPSFNTQPPEGGWTSSATMTCQLSGVSTHSRPKAAGPNWAKSRYRNKFQHTAARRRLETSKLATALELMFQHTAARRRLAGLRCIRSCNGSFNTQPPEGGWLTSPKSCDATQWFQHTAARRRLGTFICAETTPQMFQHTAARRRLVGVSYVVERFIIVSTHSRPKAAGASLKSLAPSGFAAPISLSSQEKREREYNTAFSVTPVFAIS